jgi:hypothetical protein
MKHIPEERIPEVARVVGYVLLGFLHPEDLNQEIKERLNVDAKITTAIADALNKRILAPIRADLDRAYSPLSKLETSAAISGNQKILQDISAGTPQSVKPVPTTTPSSPSLSFNKPVTVADVGWSKQPAAPKVPTPAPTAPTISAEPAPMMLHEDTAFKPAEKNANFTLPRQGTIGEMNLNRGSGVPQPAQRPAVIEFGPRFSSSPVPPKPPTPGAPAKPYSEFKPSLAAVPTANSGPRNVSQITAATSPTASVNTTPAMSIPVPIPKPPMTAPTPTTSSSIPIPPPPQIPRTPQVWHIPAQTQAPAPMPTTPSPLASAKPQTPSIPTPPKPPTPGAATAPVAPIQKDFL